MSDIQGAFVRHRRSLVLISVALSVVTVFGITGTDIRLAPGGGSVTVDIQDPKYIVWALWVVWGWCLYRYLQHFTEARKDDLAELRNRQAPPIRSKFNEKLLAAGRKSIEDTLKVKHNQPFTEIDPYKVEVHQHAVREGWKRVSGIVAIQGNYVVQEGHLRRSHGAIKEPVTLSAPWIWPMLARAILPVNLTHRYFTEYWTALALASIPVILKACQLAADT